ncbi:chemotaxis protein CheA [Clostridium mediterraneense]|uniref:chemotaxis protein CheA n=1 Tax=Clostridium mediterraneense TaxID=1805472 RepID=UPI00082C9D11|nr:chemotaxis protein CheA [Clostridium mediterraneense]
METSQYLSMFLEESRENLQVLNDCLLDLEQEPDDIDKIAQIFRVAHTIKGMAATMGFSAIAELTHKMEDVLSKFRDGELKISKDVVTILFRCLDNLERMVDDVELGGEEEFEIESMIKELEAVTTTVEKVDESINKDVEVSNNSELDLNEYELSIIKQAVDGGFNSFEINIRLSETTLLKSARTFLIVKDLEEIGEIIKSYPSTEDIESENFDFDISFILLTENNKEQVEGVIRVISEIESFSVDIIDIKQKEASLNKEITVTKIDEEIEVKPIVKEEKKETPKAKKKKSSTVNKSTHQSVRVDLERLDKLMNMVSELVINRTRLEQIAIEQKSLELNETLEEVARTTSDLQDLVMKIRMLPLDVVFNRFPRMIRDVSMELNKEVNFIIEGQETELDRTVIDEIGEPLIHLLRNAVDHGIEEKEKRVKCGKDPQGTIRLTAYQEGTKAVIKVIDDGAGINVEKVRAKAEKLGIPTENLSEAEIKNLIFSSGFSTNEKVTDLSGRGVGMDVVKTKISSLGGTVELISEEGVGSIFIIKLPLTLQIIQALLVKVGEESFAISLGFIERVIDFNSVEVKFSDSEEVIIYRDKVIPLIRLNEFFNIEESYDKRKFIVIAKVGNKQVGLLADNLLGQQEIVIKPLGKTLSSLNEYIGATILGNGKVTLILDVAALI